MMKASNNLLQVDIAGKICFFLLEDLVEVAPIKGMTPMPGSWNFVQGAMIHRGEMAFIIDMEMLLFRIKTPAEFPLALLFRHKGWLLGAGITAVQKTFRLPENIQTKTMDSYKNIPLISIRKLTEKLLHSEKNKLPPGRLCEKVGLQKECS